MPPAHHVVAPSAALHPWRSLADRPSRPRPTRAERAPKRGRARCRAAPALQRRALPLARAMNTRARLRRITPPARRAPVPHPRRRAWARFLRRGREQTRGRLRREKKTGERNSEMVTPKQSQTHDARATPPRARRATSAPEAAPSSRTTCRRRITAGTKLSQPQELACPAGLSRGTDRKTITHTLSTQRESDLCLTVLVVLRRLGPRADTLRAHSTLSRARVPDTSHSFARSPVYSNGSRAHHFTHLSSTEPVDLVARVAPRAHCVLERSSTHGTWPRSQLGRPSKSRSKQLSRKAGTGTSLLYSTTPRRSTWGSKRYATSSLHHHR